jgi:GNAT superfamily N-acetyltransferase
LAQPPSSEVLKLRPATLDDVSALEELIAESVRILQAQNYSTSQREAAIGSVFGVDRQLIRDGTYFVVEGGGTLVGCGGWSRRKTLFGSDASAGREDALLDPAADAARIRAFFVRPGYERRGIASAIMRASEEAAAAYGFTRLELRATLTGVPLYRAHGFTEAELTRIPLPSGESLPAIQMVKSLLKGA